MTESRVNVNGQRWEVIQNSKRGLVNKMTFEQRPEEMRNELEESEVRPSMAEGSARAKALREEQACPRNSWETSAVRAVGDRRRGREEVREASSCAFRGCSQSPEFLPCQSIA